MPPAPMRKYGKKLTLQETRDDIDKQIRRVKRRMRKSEEKTKENLNGT